MLVMLSTVGITYRVPRCSLTSVSLVWAAGVAMSMFIMMISFSYIVAEWCSQSHLSTEKYKDASKGLKTTRWWKKHTLYIRRVPDVAIEFLKNIYNLVLRNNVGAGKRNRRSLVWAAKVKTGNRAKSPRITGEPESVPNGNSDEDDDEYHGALLSESKDHRDPGYPMMKLSPPLETYSRSPRSSFGEQSVDLSMRPAVKQFESI